MLLRPGPHLRQRIFYIFLIFSGLVKSMEIEKNNATSTTQPRPKVQIQCTKSKTELPGPLPQSKDCEKYVD